MTTSTVRPIIRRALACASLALCAATAQAQEAVTLKVHFFLPVTSFANQLFITPWCEKIARESADRLKCQIYPSMQLGGAPAQLYEQVRDGLADVVWTLPGYTAGRFPSVEAFELPFMMQNPEATSKALWDFVQMHSLGEFKDVKPLAFHVHGDGVFHTTKKPVQTLADMRGMKLRAPTRMTNRFIAMLGATPVSMPVPQVGDALSKGVIDGAVVPYEVVPSVKLHELAKFHSETDPAEPAFYTSTFIFAMNNAKYDSLPADLKKVIDANSGQALSGQIGKAFLQADGIGKRGVNRNTVNVIPSAELAQWKVLGAKLAVDWVAEMNGKGLNGKLLMDDAKALIAKHAAAR